MSVSRAGSACPGRGRPVISAIAKLAVTGRVAVGGVNVAGDEQADRSVYGGPDKAVYAYAGEDAAWWATGLGRAWARRVWRGSHHRRGRGV
jgi:MOSC domain-containing protein YiiM